MRKETEQLLSAFIKEWDNPTDGNNTKETFLRFKDLLEKKEETALDFISRPGVTYSLRAVHRCQEERSLFVMVDVIEDSERWLSVCFYGDMITDPDERGDFVPGGLLGDDAICFDLEETNEGLIRYIETRFDEAHHRSSKGCP